MGHPIAENRNILKLPPEERGKYVSPNLIKEYPSNFENYITANADKIERATERGTLPYWIRDNQTAVSKILNRPLTREGKEIAPMISAKERAAIRHAARTPEQIQAIQNRWDERKAFNKLISGDLTEWKPLSMQNAPISDIEKDLRALWGIDGRKFDLQSENMKRFYYDWSLKQKRYAEWMDTYNKLLVPHINEQKKTWVWARLTPIEREAYSTFMREYRAMYGVDYGRASNALEGIVNFDFLKMKKVDFDKVSIFMPHQLLPKGVWLGDVDYQFDKEFFDKMTRFRKVIISNDDKGFCHKSYVHLGKKDKRYMSAEYRKSLVYHEYGHAIFDIHNVNENRELKAFMRKWNGIWNEKVNKFAPSINTKGYELDFELQRAHNALYKTDDKMTHRSWGAISKIWNSMDTMQSITTYKYGCVEIDGHTKKYWNLGAYYRRTELFAHICENRFAGNAYMRDILGEDFYKEMTALFDKIIP